MASAAVMPPIPTVMSYYFNVIDPDNNVCEITGGYHLSEEETDE